MYKFKQNKGVFVSILAATASAFGLYSVFGQTNEVQLDKLPSTTPIQYSVEGSISFFVGNEQAPKFVRPFEMTYSNADWSMHLVADDLEGVDSYDLVHLDDTIYSYTSLGKIKPNNKVQNNATANISIGDVPEEVGMFTSYIWLALASVSYFKNVTNNEVHPIWTGIDTKNYFVKADWEFFDRPPYILKHLIYYGKAGRFPPPFDKGWKASEFHVLSETNVENYRFPLESEYEQFKPKRERATNAEDLESQFRVKVVVSSVRLNGSASIVPPSTRGATLVEDLRFSDVSNTGVVYLSKSTRLPNKPEAIAIEEYRAQKTSAHILNYKTTRINKKVKTIICFLFIFSTIVLIVFAAQNKKNKND